MEWITEYRMACGQDPSTLAGDVQRLIADGWQPFGSVTVIRWGMNHSIMLVQPVVKYGLQQPEYERG